MSDYMIGVDEVGLGSWAGPILCCAVAVPKDWTPPEGLNDSKRLTKAKRAKLYNVLREVPRVLAWASAEHIDQVGVRVALIASHTRAVSEMLERYPGADVILDGDVRLPTLPQVRCIPKADATFAHVMAASVIAKVTRDWEMARLSKEYRGYSFEKNAGYGTAAHLECIARLGPSGIHRRSYEPIRSMVAATRP